MTTILAANNWAEWDAEHPYIPHPRTKKIELFTPHGEYKDAQAFSEKIRMLPTEAFKKENGWNPIDASDISTTQADKFFMQPANPLKAWLLYQTAGSYNEINDALRGHPHPYTEYDGTNLSKKIPAAFKEYGAPTTDNFSFYRGVKNRAGFDISQFQVGSVFEEKGVVSTSPDFNEVLSFEADNRTIEQGNMAVIELQTPKGTQVLGGMEGTIEVMMAPGTKYRVTDVKQGEHIGNYTQADGTKIKGGTITYVTAEVLP